MKRYIWQNKSWQDFKYDKGYLMELLSKARFLQGQLLGKASSLDIKLQTEAQSEILIEETIKTSKIEGVELNIESVRSSVAEELGFPKRVGLKQDKNVSGLVNILIDATYNHTTPLTMERINSWHASLFPSGYSSYGKITTGDLRNRNVSVVSGYIGKEKIHFETPPVKQARQDFKIFINWFNNSFKKEDGLLRAASAHLKFVTIHPYDDGNGRLSRVVMDMAMAQDENNGIRFYSLSSQIMEERKKYYQVLEEVQTLKANLTQWYEWFINMFINALKNSEKIFQSAFFKAAFWNKIKDIQINERQRKVIKKLLDIDNFEGGLTTKKYSHLTKVSNATAFREMADIQAKGILIQYGAGRNVRYELNKKIIK